MDADGIAGWGGGRIQGELQGARDRGLRIKRKYRRTLLATLSKTNAFARSFPLAHFIIINQSADLEDPISGSNSVLFEAASRAAAANGSTNNRNKMH